MSKSPEISIIIPVYNVQDYLEKCLDSVKNQTFKNWEAICVNDGSTDNSLEILQQYAEKDERFVIINQENDGVSSARNNGLNSARGKYIMFLDSDDFIHPQCMEIAHKTIIDTDSDVCDFQLTKVLETEEILYKKFSEVVEGHVIEEPLKRIIQGEADKGLLNFCKKIYKAEIAKKNVFSPINVGEDVLYTFQSLNICKKISTIPNCFLFYVQRENSISHEKDKHKRYKQKVLFVTNLLNAVNDVSKEHCSDVNYIKNLRKYISNKIFNVYIMRAFRIKLSADEIRENLSQLSDMVKRGDCNISLLRLRFRVLYYLLSHNHYYLAKLLV